MGSGGPRGLQIPRSGVNRVRGGFDSHAFPPFLLVLITLSVIGGPVSVSARTADPAALDSGAAVTADTTVANPASATPAAPGITAPDPTRPTAHRGPAGAASGAPSVGEKTFDTPRWVMLRSLVVPGWGQWHNHSFVKAAALGGVEGWLVTRMVSDNRSLDRLRRDVEAAQQGTDDARAAAAVAAYNRRLDRIVSGQWMLAAVVSYALLDAYVDAHFRHFKVEFEHDPALPEGFSSGPGVRLLLRWGY